MMWLVSSLFRCFASLKLAVTLLPILAAVLACATVLETRDGAAYARWYVYETKWFVGLLALLGVNIFCAAAIRFPWKRHQLGFVVTHCGLLVLLAGAVLSFQGSVEGRVSLAEGASAHDVTLDRRSQITTFWVGRPQEPPYEFMFDGGPVNWEPGKLLDVGEVDDVRVRILGFFQSARPLEEWVPDESKLGGPAVKFRVCGSDGVAVADSWLIDQQFGDAISLGPLRLQLQRAVADGMLTDFLQPAAQELGEKGVLVIVYEDVIQRVLVDQHVGQRIKIGETGAEVEIASYLPNARPDKLGNFSSKGDQPKNPMVELRVHLPGEDRPLRQIAFAKDPLLNLDGVYPRICPVKFRLHHSAIQPTSGVELLQTSDGKLFGRLCVGGAYQPQGEIKPGHNILTPGNFRLEIVQHLEHARKKVTFQAADVSLNRKEKNEPAALVEVTAGGTTQQVWLRRNDATYGQQKITTKNGLLALNYGYGRAPLGYSLTLIDFRRDMNPGNAGNAGFSSKVRVVDSQRHVDEERMIAMNEPLSYGKFTLYQSSFDEAGHGREASTFSAAYDPGRMMKYSGSLMICFGIAIMFYMRAYFFKHKAQASRPARNEFGSEPMPEELESAA